MINFDHFVIQENLLFHILIFFGAIIVLAKWRPFVQMSGLEVYFMLWDDAWSPQIDFE